MKTLYLILAILLFGELGNALCKQVSIPKHFTIENSDFEVNSFSVKMDDFKIGTVNTKLRQRGAEISKTFTFRDETRVLVATGIEVSGNKTKSLPSVVDVFDCPGRKIGSFSEVIIKSHGHLLARYFVMDPMGKLLFSTKKLKTYIRDERVTLKSLKGLDPKVMVIFAAYNRFAKLNRTRMALQ